MNHEQQKLGSKTHQQQHIEGSSNGMLWRSGAISLDYADGFMDISAGCSIALSVSFRNMARCGLPSHHSVLKLYTERAFAQWVLLLRGHLLKHCLSVNLAQEAVCRQEVRQTWCLVDLSLPTGDRSTMIVINNATGKDWSAEELQHWQLLAGEEQNEVTRELRDVCWKHRIP